MTYTTEIRNGHHIVTMISPEEVLIAWLSLKSEVERIVTSLFETMRETIENILDYYEEERQLRLGFDDVSKLKSEELYASKIEARNIDASQIWEDE